MEEVLEDKYSILYYSDGVLHRTNGPAIECKNGSKAWYVNGKPHREDGPAVIFLNGVQEWYLHGMKMTEWEWKKAVGIICDHPEFSRYTADYGKIGCYKCGQIFNA